MITVFLVDDHETVREGLRLLVNMQPDMKVISEAGDGATAVQQAPRFRPRGFKRTGEVLVTSGGALVASDTVLVVSTGASAFVTGFLQPDTHSAVSATVPRMMIFEAATVRTGAAFRPSIKAN